MDQALVASQFLHQFKLELTPLAPPSDLFNLPTSRTHLHCHWKRPFTKGQQLRLWVPAITHESAADTLVIACSSNSQGYRLTLAFTNEEQAFRFRMVEQLCHIHHYHRQMQHQGRRLSLNEAACEWISRFACSFTSATASL